MTKDLLVLLVGCFAATVAAGGDQGVSCKHCGQTATPMRTLVSSTCPKHPAGFAKGKHSPAR